MVPGLDEFACSRITGVVERGDTVLPAASVGDEEPRCPRRESPLPHSLRTSEQPRMVKPPALPRLQKGSFGVVVTDHSHDSSSAIISAVTAPTGAAASITRQRSGSLAAISAKRTARRA